MKHADLFRRKWKWAGAYVVHFAQGVGAGYAATTDDFWPVGLGLAYLYVKYNKFEKMDLPSDQSALDVRDFQAGFIVGAVLGVARRFVF